MKAKLDGEKQAKIEVQEKENLTQRTLWQPVCAEWESL